MANIENDKQPNFVQELYNQFTDDEMSAKITEIVKPDDLKAELEVIYQTVDNLHKACPKNLGDWYFTGDYPTKGGMRVVNKAFVNFHGRQRSSCLLELGSKYIVYRLS